MCLGKKPKAAKAPDPVPEPKPTDPEIGEAELRRKRAAAGAAGRQSTIATSGLGYNANNPEQKVGS